MKLTIKYLSSLWAFIVLAGCATPVTTPTIDANSIMTAAAGTAFVRLTQIAAIPTATTQVVPSQTSVPTATVMLQPTSIPTIEPISAVVSANSRVRGIPAKSDQHDLGGMLKGQSVKVIGRNDAATWFFIVFADSPTGTAWITTGAVTFDKDMGLLPIVVFPNGLEAAPIMLPPFIYKVTGTPLPPGEPPAGWTKYGTLLQQANVRVGPSVGFVSIGVLSPGAKVTFQGRIADNSWVQIAYPSGPEGHGWILARLLQAHDGFSDLPYFDVLGTPVTPTPENAGADITPNATLMGDVTATPQPPTSTGAQAEVTNQINVRSGPAQKYESYGMLNPKDKVIVTGLTLNKYWYQIEFKASPTGFGWVASQYIRVTGDMRQLPYYNDLGTPVP